MRYPDSRILIFSKAPLAGRVKSRLAPAIGHENAAVIHSYLTERVIEMAVGAKCAPVEVWCAPDCGHSFFQACGRKYDVKLRSQQGNDLGERMCQAFQSSLEQCESVVIIGSDLPALVGGDLLDAFEQLNNRGMECVFSPTEDGGYGLIGSRHAEQRVFTNIAWGTSRVMVQTRERLQQLNWRWHELSTLWDVDIPTDLLRLAELPLPDEVLLIIESMRQ